MAHLVHIMRGDQIIFGQKEIRHAAMLPYPIDETFDEEH